MNVRFISLQRAGKRLLATRCSRDRDGPILPSSNDSSAFSSIANLRRGFQPPTHRPTANPPQDRGSTLVLGGGNTVKEWEVLDEQVNEYPMRRQFSAIGSGDGFKDSVVAAVAKATGSQIQADDIIETLSSGAKYVSVRVSVVVRSSEDVKRVFEAIKSNPALKWCM